MSVVVLIKQDVVGAKERASLWETPDLDASHDAHRLGPHLFVVCGGTGVFCVWSVPRGLHVGGSQAAVSSPFRGSVGDASCAHLLAVRRHGGLHRLPSADDLLCEPSEFGH